jgi:hypothetical protein
MPTRTKLRQRPQAQKQIQQQTQKVVTKNAVKITQAQSLELTKTFVHTSVSAMFQYLYSIHIDNL